ncbi:hypothetical protein ABFX02_13G094200 [Erythranthe guttata]
MCNPILLYVAMAAICEEKYAYSATMKDTPSTRFPKTFTQQVKSYIRNFYELMMSDKISSVTVSGSYQLHKPLNCHAEIKKLLLPKEICPAIHLYKLTELYVLAYLVGSSSYIITTDRQNCYSIFGRFNLSAIGRTMGLGDASIRMKLKYFLVLYCLG